MNPDGKFKPNQHEGRLVKFLKDLPVGSYTDLGIELGLNKTLIDNETYQPSKKPLDCHRDLIALWLKSKRKDRTWGILVNALENINQGDIARKVTEDHSKEVPHNDHGKLMQLLRPTASRWNQLANALNVPQSEIQVIAHENDYQRQLSEILNIWLRGNGKDRTPEVLISALETIGEGSLAEVLSKNHEFYALVGRKPPGPNDTEGDDLLDGDDLHDTKSEMETMNLALPDISNVTIESQERTDTQGKEMGSYSMTSLPRGYCLIVDNWRFKNGDAHLKHSELTCFVVIILTHGDHGILYGTDGKTVSIDKEIIEPFRGNNCPNLLDKPKLFIFQACQGGKEDGGVTKDHEQSKVEDDVETGESTDQLKIPTEADILAAYAVPPGYAAWRHEENGSWFIQSIVEAIRDYSEDHDLVSILTEVNRKVAEEYETSKTKGEKKQISTFVSQLRYKLYLKKAYVKKEEEKRAKKKRKNTNTGGNQTKRKK